MVLSLIVLCRILSNPFSNVFQKILTRRRANPLFVIFVTHGILSAACLPLLLLSRAGEPRAFWVNMGAVAVLTVASNALLVQAVKLADLSVLGPVNAYKSIISLVPGMILLREFPGAVGVAGMALIVAGSYFIVDKSVTEPRRNLFLRFFTDRGVRYRLAAMTLSAIEAVFLKKALLASAPLMTFAAWAVLGFAASLIAVALIARQTVREEYEIARVSAPVYLWLVLTTGLMQLCTIIVFRGFQVGYALALFQTSALISVFLGYRLFEERNILERLTGSVVMVGGAVLIVLGR
jgi:drug/metabolite transporter (DMT)-like permease